MPPSGDERKVEPGIYYNRRSGTYSARVSVGGKQLRRSAGPSLERAREIWEMLQQQREAHGEPRTRGVSNYARRAHTADRLPLTQQEENPGMAIDTEDETREDEDVEIPDALRPAYDALTAQRDTLQDQAIPLRQQLADLERGIERVQGAIDALEGREPDASAALRQPGALRERLPAGVRAAFSAGGGAGRGAGSRRRPMLSRAQSDELRDAVFAALPVGEAQQIGRGEVTSRVNESALPFHVSRDQVSRALAYLIEDQKAARNHPENPKDIRYWRIEDGGE